ncbi:hypothetical protein BJY59DRAFT_259423 [Rhodotorula toruloides]
MLAHAYDALVISQTNLTLVSMKSARQGGQLAKDGTDIGRHLEVQECTSEATTLSRSGRHRSTTRSRLSPTRGSLDFASRALVGSEVLLLLENRSLVEPLTSQRAPRPCCTAGPPHPPSPPLPPQQLSRALTPSDGPPDATQSLAKHQTSRE